MASGDAVLPVVARNKRVETSRRSVPGPVGEIELLIDAPSFSPLGLVLVAHPQPLLGGHAMHKVPHLLARACQAQGWLAVRPNFRGVGATAGHHDAGTGETDDLIAVIDAMEAEMPALPLALIGFSFGAFVQARVACRLGEALRPAKHVVLAGMPVGTVEGGRTYEVGALPIGSVVVHGEFDERVPLTQVFQWARVHSLPVTVIPGADHFFKGKLPILRALVEGELRRQ